MQVVVIVEVQTVLIEHEHSVRVAVNCLYFDVELGAYVEVDGVEPYQVGIRACYQVWFASDLGDLDVEEPVVAQVYAVLFVVVPFFVIVQL